MGTVGRTCTPRSASAACMLLFSNRHALVRSLLMPVRMRSPNLLCLALSLGLAAPTFAARAAVTHQAPSAPFAAVKRISSGKSPKVRPVLRLSPAPRTPAITVRTKTDGADKIGDRMADKVANVAGSWKFIGGATAGMAAWIAFNMLSGHPFDAPPFVGLNLVLSTVAALQAPFILMSANRQSSRDRLRLEEDFQLNTHEQGEIAALHTKIDQLTLHIEKLSKSLAAK